MIFKCKQNDKEAIIDSLHLQTSGSSTGSCSDRNEDRPAMITVTLVGDAKVGKTSLVRWFKRIKFTRAYTPTVGVERTRITLPHPNNAVQKLDCNFLDTNDVFLDFTTVMTVRRNSSHSSLCSYILVVYDITDHRTFEAAKDWVSLVRGMIRPDVQLVLVGNMTDRAKHRAVHKTAGEVFAILNNMIFVETSAKNGHNLKRLLAFLSSAGSGQ